MGLLNKLFGAIFSFFSWLLSLVRGGKKSEYFLEIDESQAAPAAKAEAKPESANSQPAEAKAKPTAPPQIAAASQPQVVMPTIPTASAPQNGAKASEDQPKPTQAPQSENKPNQAPQPVATTSSTSASSNNSTAASNQTFAPQYLNPSKNQSQRRRPGANMGAFMSMAKEVKPSS